MSKDTPEAAPRDDGTVRQAHYGAGRQPWDDIMDLGWGPEFAAGNVLRYLRRDPGLKGVDRERDLRHARWYYAALCKLGSTDIHTKLMGILSAEETWLLK